MKRFLIITLCFFSLQIQASYVWNESLKEAYNDIIHLKFENGKNLLEKEKKLNPKNRLPYLLENYIYFLKIQIGEEQSDYEEGIDRKNHLLEKLKSSNVKSPWVLYSQSEFHLQWAANKLKFKDYLSAAIDINKAYRLLQKNQKLFPNFKPNSKGLGVLHALIGSVPDKYSWTLSIIGMNGSIDQGMSELASLIEKLKQNDQYSFLLDETYFLYSFLKMNLQNDRKGLQEILRDIQKSDNLLLNFAACRIASKIGKNDLAIEILKNREQSEAHYPFLYLEYLMGVYKQNKLDPNAIHHFDKYVKHFNGKNYIKSAYMRISWHYLLNGEIDNFELARANIYYFGTTMVGADKEAQESFEKKTQPQLHLLQARLLFDGGYYNEALGVINQIENPMFFSNGHFIIKYFYRKGRIYDALEETSLAIENYHKTIDLGRHNRAFYASKSALQIGLIFEEKGNIIKAKYYFEDCISMKDHQYEQSLEQKAKAGINRLY